MLEDLFGSEYKADLIKLFLQEENPLTAKVVAKSIGATSAKTVAELKVLQKFGLVEKVKLEKDHAWQLNKAFPLIPELKALVIKSLVLMEKELSRRISQLKGIKLLVFTGVFVGKEELGTDILLVGSTDKKVLQRLMTHVSKEFGHDLRFTVLSMAEYRSRRQMTDKFLYEVLNNQPIVAVDNF